MSDLYLDYAGSTPCAPEVAKCLYDALLDPELQGNPSAGHGYGQIARERIDQARRDVAHLIGASASDIHFTSGATEADNLAIWGVMQANDFQGELITTEVEHKAVLEVTDALALRGVTVHKIPVQANGQIDLAAFDAAVNEQTVLVSTMHVNNELGTIMPLAAIGERLVGRDVCWHVDAAQSVGKISVDLSVLPIDLLSLSGHKFYGPKGTGALFVRRRRQVKIAPMLFGGGQERGLRPGTLATPGILALGEAAKLAQASLDADLEHLSTLRSHFLSGIAVLDGISLNTDPECSVSGILNIAFAKHSSQAVIQAFPHWQMAAGSACSSKSAEVSHVLSAIGCSNERALNSLRLSFGRQTSLGDIDELLQEIKRWLSS